MAFHKGSKLSTMDFWFPRITENSSTLRVRLSKTLDPKLRLGLILNLNPKNPKP